MLSQTATIQSLSFYVTTAGGNLRLGIYDSNGSGGPGALKASTASFTPAAGWNTQVVSTPVALPAGTYWLSYLPSSDALGFRKAQNASSSGRYYSMAYGPLPANFSSTPSNDGLPLVVLRHADGGRHSAAATSSATSATAASTTAAASSCRDQMVSHSYRAVNEREPPRPAAAKLSARRERVRRRRPSDPRRVLQRHEQG